MGGCDDGVSWSSDTESPSRDGEHGGTIRRSDHHIGSSAALRHPSYPPRFRENRVDEDHLGRGSAWFLGRCIPSDNSSPWPRAGFLATVPPSDDDVSGSLVGFSPFVFLVFLAFSRVQLSVVYGGNRVGRCVGLCRDGAPGQGRRPHRRRPPTSRALFFVFFSLARTYIFGQASS